MADESEQGRSEQPTSYKLSKARERGAVARGLDLGFATSIAAFAAYMWVEGRALGERIASAARGALVGASTLLDTRHAMFTAIGATLGAALRPIALMAATIFLVVLVFEIVQTGFVFTTKPLSPDFGRLDPAKGFKRVFSVRMLIETGKAVLKLGAYAAIAILVLLTVRNSVTPTIADAPQLADAMRRTGFRLLLLFVAAAAAFALLDQFIARRGFLKQMRMSRREVRRELRDREGEPRMKRRRKQLHAEFVKMSQSVRNIRGADVLITNPTHFAVALKYDRKENAPRVVSRGANHFALRLRRLASLYGVVIVENRLLAKALYGCEMGKPIPESLFRPVADIYLAIRDRKRARQDARQNARQGAGPDV